MQLVSDVIIKFCKEKAYVEDILNGRIFMNELGSVISDNDNYRSDIMEGQQLLVTQNDSHARFEYIDDNNSLDIILPAGTNIKQGFISNDKTPFFSAAMLNENNIERVNENQYRLKKKFVQHMMQFGNYAVWFSKKEFIEKVEQYVLKCS